MKKPIIKTLSYLIPTSKHRKKFRNNFYSKKQINEKKEEKNEYSYAKIKIGKYDLILNLNSRIEERYFESYLTGIGRLDPLIARHFIKKGDVIIDGGANIGFVALKYLQYGAKEVHCFEPIPNIYNRLLNLEGEELKAYNIALSDKKEICEMYVSQFHNQGSTLDKNIAKRKTNLFGEEKVIIKVKSDNIDNLFPNKKIDFIKIDVEGQEAKVFKGANKLLSKNPPRVMHIECHDGYFEETYNELKKYFKYIKGVFVDKDTYELFLSDVDLKNPHVCEGINAITKKAKNFIVFNDLKEIKNIPLK